MWFSREISTLWSEPTEHVQAILGVRQSGKTSLLARLAGPARRFVTLDDAGALDLAVSDPRLFLATFPPPVIIDECQLAAPLFPAIKVVVDEWRRAQRPVGDASIWLTGSHQMLVDARIAEFKKQNPDIEVVHNHFPYADYRTKVAAAIPAGQGPDVVQLFYGWLDDYIRTVLERDVALLFGIEKIAAFIKCARLLAGHIGQLLNMSEIARGAGVKASTISDWTGALARMGFFHFVEPWSVNPVSRLVKAPKVYACDPGVAARLQGWSEAGPLAVSPAVGPLFENLTFLEILKARDHHGRAWRISTLRSRDGEEVDFVVEDGSNRAVAVEAKMTRPSLAGLKPPTTLGRLLPGARYVVVSAADGPTIERPDVTLLPLARLAGHLLEHLG